MQSIYQLLILILTWLAVPVILIAAYDKWVLEPKRPRTPEGEPKPGPLYTRVAGNLLPFVLIAAVITIGTKEVFDLVGEIAVPLSWVSLPLVIVVQMTALTVAGMYRGLWRYTSIGDITMFVRAVGGASRAARTSRANCWTAPGQLHCTLYGAPQ